jgi:diguanylate cyclase (GGDEF)-like protein/putative nucleotidyltransferase with HDIG domain
MYRIKILLVEDDPGHQHLIAGSLTSAQGQVELEVVSTGREAVRAIRKRFFDCILLDFNLPDARADELLPVLAKDERMPPVIVISSSRDQDTAIKSLRNGCVDFLPKMEALNSDKLWRCVEAALRKRHEARAERRKLERRIDHLARLADKDPLTGLSNRRCLDRLFEERRITSDRRGLASVIMLDLDHFKGINDRHGHGCGDRVLRAVADTLRNCARRKDAVCRYGGEEFVIIKPMTSHAVAVHWAEMLREKLAQLEIRSGDRRVPVTVSIGVVNCASGSLGPQMVSRSDRAMYLAKRRGRNMVCSWQMVLFHEAAHRVASSSRQPVDERLRDVLTQTREHLGRTQWHHLTTHSRYVSKLAVRLGKALGFDEGALERLRVAGLCHDLGKFLIPEEVLAKPGALCEEERTLLARHSADGAEMSLMLGADPVAADYIRSHHARCDGPGAVDSRDHPILQGARILGIADALVAMTSYRTYQPGRSFTGAMRELQRESGGQFDPEVVAAVPRALLSDVYTGGARLLSSRSLPACQVVRLHLPAHAQAEVEAVIGRVIPYRNRSNDDRIGVKFSEAD